MKNSGSGVEAPSAIYVIPTEGLDDSEILDSVLVTNLKPGPGSRCIILPEAGQGRPHPRVDAIYVVTVASRLRSQAGAGNSRWIGLTAHRTRGGTTSPKRWRERASWP